MPFAAVPEASSRLPYRPSFAFLLCSSLLPSSTHFCRVLLIKRSGRRGMHAVCWCPVVMLVSRLLDRSSRVPFLTTQWSFCVCVAPDDCMFMKVLLVSFLILLLRGKSLSLHRKIFSRSQVGSQQCRTATASYTLFPLGVGRKAYNIKMRSS